MASLTVPGLVASYQKKVYVTQLKAANSMLNQAVMQLKADNEGTMIGVFDGMEDVLDKLCTKIKCLERGSGSDFPPFYGLGEDS